MNEWNTYSIGSPSTKANWINKDCQPFTEVSHVSHVESAIGILQAGKIDAGLVYDKSKLNQRRILVSWCSPNYWGNGFRYGNVRFSFNFRELLGKQKAYWVEVIDYKIPALRILISNTDRSSKFPIYDPTQGDGPWWYDQRNNIDYFNGHYCLEFMFEQPIGLNDLTGFDFVNHHPEYCSVHRKSPQACKYLGRFASDGGALFFAHLAGRGLSIGRYAKHLIAEGKFKNEIVALGVRAILLLKKLSYAGAVTNNGDLALPLARAFMNAIASRKLPEAKQLASLFKDEENFKRALAQVIAEALGSKDVEIVVAAINRD